MSINILQALRKRANLSKNLPQPYVGDLLTRTLTAESLPQRLHTSNNSRVVRTSQSKKTISFLFCFIILLAIPVTNFLIKNQTPNQGRAATSSSFVTRQGGDLYMNGQKLRFAGANMYWLGLSEDGSLHYPSHADIDSAINDAHTMGATVVRSMAVLSVGCSLCIEPALEVFNDGTNGKPNAFDSIDYAIYAAKMRNIRLILPLVDNYNYFQGGKFTYLQWRGIATDAVGSQFFTDNTVRNDFKNHVQEVLDHVNPYTGVAYKNEPTILAWETGNELSVYPNTWTYSEWTGDIANFIKVTLGAQQLVADGKYGIYSSGTAVDIASMQLNNVDIYSTHSYDNFRTPQEVVNESNITRSYGKAFFLGEYSWTGRGTNGNPLAWTLSDMLSTIESSNVTGDLYWELLPNSMSHDDGFTLHWARDSSNKQNSANQLQSHAFIMCPATSMCRNMTAPTTIQTPTPTLPVAATPTPTSPAVIPTPASNITMIDDAVMGSGQDQLNYVGARWYHCTDCNERSPMVTYYDASQSWDKGKNDYVTLSFTGTQLYFYGVTASWHGIGAVSIDGGTEIAIDFYSVNKTGNVLLWTSPVLPYGFHTFKLRITGRHNVRSTGYYVTVDRIGIRKGNLSA